MGGSRSLILLGLFGPCKVVASPNVREGRRLGPGAGHRVVLVAHGYRMLELEQERGPRRVDHGAASKPTAPTTTTPTGPLVLTGQQRLSPLYAQGVARIPNGWIFSGTNSLWKTTTP